MNWHLFVTIAGIGLIWIVFGVLVWATRRKTTQKQAVPVKPQEIPTIEAIDKSIVLAWAALRAETEAADKREYVDLLAVRGEKNNIWLYKSPPVKQDGYWYGQGPETHIALFPVREENKNVLPAAMRALTPESEPLLVRLEVLK